MAVVSVTEDQKQDASGNLQDVYDVTFTIPGATGNFLITVPQSGDPIAAAHAAIDAKTAQVSGILGI
jgi:hypothetical protein